MKSQTELFFANIRHAARALDGGDPETAVEHLETAIALAPDLDARKLAEKAHEEASIGNPEKAEHLIEMILQDCKTSDCKTSNSGTAQHTPGPWETGAVMTRVEVLPQGWRMPMLIADCHGKHSPESEAERVANARLIAAAPGLLAALQSVIDYAENEAFSLSKHKDSEECEQDAIKANEACEIARAAIAKATGK